MKQVREGRQGTGHSGSNTVLLLFWIAIKKMSKPSSGKRANEGAGSASSPPLKRQKIGAASSSTAVSVDEMAAQNLLLAQRLQSAEDENARLQVDTALTR